MQTLTDPKLIAGKLGIDSITESEGRRIREWIDSIEIEQADANSITSERLSVKQIDFSRLSNSQSSDLILDLSEAFRYFFTNTYSEFIFFPSEGRKYSLHELLDMDPATMFPVDTIYSFPLDCLHKESSLDKSTVEHPMFCHDPDAMFRNIRKKLEQRGHAAIIHDIETGMILGFAFGYPSRLIEAWSLEEWIHPFVYSRFDENLDKLQRSNVELFEKLRSKYFNRFSDYLIKLNALIKDHSDLFDRAGCKKDYGADDLVYVFNAITSHPQIRRISRPTKLGEACLSMIDEKTRKNRMAVGESTFQSNAYKMFKVGGMKDIYGILNDSSSGARAGESILMAGPLSSVLETVSLPHREFMKRYIRYYKKHITP